MQNAPRRVSVGPNGQFFKEVKQFEDETGSVVVHGGGHQERTLEQKLRGIEDIKDAARLLVDHARMHGTSRYLFRGVELHATEKTDASDLEHVFAVKFYGTQSRTL